MAAQEFYNTIQRGAQFLTTPTAQKAKPELLNYTALLTTKTNRETISIQ